MAFSFSHKLTYLHRKTIITRYTMLPATIYYPNPIQHASFLKCKPSKDVLNQKLLWFYHFNVLNNTIDPFVPLFIHLVVSFTFRKQSTWLQWIIKPFSPDFFCSSLFLSPSLIFSIRHFHHSFIPFPTILFINLKY